MSKVLGGKKKAPAPAEASAGWEPIITPLSELNPSARNGRTRGRRTSSPGTLIGDSGQFSSPFAQQRVGLGG